VHVGFVTTLLDDDVDVCRIVHVPSSPVENPLPDTVTRAVNGPDEGFNEIAGPVTVKVADAESPVLP